MTWLLQEQYIFVYEALLEALKAGETTIPNSAFRATYEELCNQRKEDDKRTLLEEQFQVSHVTTVPNSAFWPLIGWDIFNFFFTITEQNSMKLVRNKISMSYTKFVFFEPIGKPRWLSWPLIGWDIFDFLASRDICPGS